MISWIQNHLIRHGRWIFLTLLAVIIVSFVFTIGNTPGCTADRSGYEPNLFYGIDMNSQVETQPLEEKVFLNARLNGQQIRSGEEFQNQLVSRIALLHLADEIGVPVPDQAAIAEFITTKNAFRGPDGQFSPEAYTSFVDNIESNPNTPQGLVLKVLEEDYRINQISSALGGPGYVLPTEAVAQTQRNQTSYELSIAELNYNEFSPEISPDEATLKEYYENNKLRYEIPERIKASYAFFAASSFDTEIPAFSDAELREHFIANRARFVAEYEAANPSPTPAEGEEVPAPTPVTFETVRESVTNSLKAEQQTRAANVAAQAFAYTLYRDEIARESTAFSESLANSSAQLISIEPYTQAGASQRALSADLLESAFKLGGNRYYSDAYEVDGGFAVLLYEGRIAPEIPAYEAVQSQVTGDYISEEKRRLFNEKGESLKSELEAALAEGKKFAEAAETLELNAQSYEKFIAKDAPRELNRTFLQEAQSMQAGEISPMITTGGIGAFVYLQTKEVPEIDSENEDFSTAQEMLARFAAFSSSGALINEVVAKGLPEPAELSE